MTARLGSLPRPLCWALVIVAVTLASEAFGVLRLPSPLLFGGLAAGIVYALAPTPAITPPRRLMVATQVVLGVIVGSTVRTSTLHSVAVNWGPVLFVCVTTLALSVLSGLVLARVAPVDRITASLGTIAGGATGIISMSDELGADARLVAVLQYLRILMIVVLTPFIATAAFGFRSGVHPVHEVGADALRGLLYVAVCGAAGLGIGRLVRLPVAAMLGPMLLSAALTLAGAPLVAPVPPVVQTLALAFVGLQVGLRFTPASLRAAWALVPWAIGLTVVLLAVSALLGVLLARMTGSGELEAYLATTPGGLYSIVALSLGSNVDMTYVLSVQLIRTFLMLLLAPWLARWIAGRAAAPVPAPETAI